MEPLTVLLQPRLLEASWPLCMAPLVTSPQRRSQNQTLSSDFLQSGTLLTQHTVTHTNALKFHLEPYPHSAELAPSPAGRWLASMAPSATTQQKTAQEPEPDQPGPESDQPEPVTDQSPSPLTSIGSIAHALLRRRRSPRWRTARPDRGFTEPSNRRIPPMAALFSDKSGAASPGSKPRMAGVFLAVARRPAMRVSTAASPPAPDAFCGRSSYLWP